MEISGFRAFSGTARFDLNGDIVIVAAANGQGKTSLFDAIHWGITGELARLERRDSIVSLYSTSGEARVEVAIALKDGRRLVVTRRSDGLRDNLQVRDGDEVFSGPQAEHQLLHRLWPSGLVAQDSLAALRSALERGVYLQQDVLTGFLTADSDQQRFNAISELIGAGRATELQDALERSRRAWSRATTQRESEMADTERRQFSLESQLRELVNTASTVNIDPDEWNSWWTRAREQGVTIDKTPHFASSDSQADLDAAMAELRALRSRRERRRVRLEELANMLKELPSTEPDLESLRRAVTETTEALVTAQKHLSEAEDRAEELRRRQLERRTQQEELKVLAEIALRHLGDHCPICQQDYDQESTRQRLQMLIHDTSYTPEPTGSIPDLIEMTERVHALNHQASSAREYLQDAQRQESARQDVQQRILAELELSLQLDSDISLAIESAIEGNSSALESLATAMVRGEALALSMARVGELARRSEVEKELMQVRLELSIARNEIESRLRTRGTVSQIIESLRSASSDLVEEELKRLDPLVQRIYATADPNPEFRVVRLTSRMHRGHGRVMAEIEDPLHNIRRDSPSSFLSSSQMNVLAVSVFLALNLGISTLPLEVAILDDPLQSLDDLNLIGLIDLLRRMRDRRQLMISTHDNRFAALLERKLRPVSRRHRTILIRLSGWSSKGPIAVQGDIERDPTPIRIAAA